MLYNATRYKLSTRRRGSRTRCGAYVEEAAGKQGKHGHSRGRHRALQGPGKKEDSWPRQSGARVQGALCQGRGQSVLGPDVAMPRAVEDHGDAKEGQEASVPGWGCWGGGAGSL